jgi:hypothetical protein
VCPAGMQTTAKDLASKIAAAISRGGPDGRYFPVNNASPQGDAPIGSELEDSPALTVMPPVSHVTLATAGVPEQR